jgi:ATP-dependent Clp endopeptidase proteolytic subunit ClpP
MIFNKAENKTEININDEIGFWGITHTDFTNQLNGVEGDIQLNIASYGGVVSDAFAIYNSLKSHKGRVTANIYGDSASSATLIAMAADEIRIADNVMFLIHNVWGGVTGEADDLRKAADNMDKVNDNIIEAYKKKTGLNKNTIKSLMNKGDWMTAKEAKSNGFVDSIVQAEDVFNRSESVLMNCANEEMKKALLEKVNTINNKNQFQMTEDNKSWFQEQFDNLKNSFKTEEPKVEEVVETKEETISKEEVSEMLNSVKEEISNVKATNETIVNAKDEEIAKLKAELEKKNANPTEVKAESKNPEEDTKKEVESCSGIAKIFVNRMNRKYGSVINFKTK